MPPVRPDARNIRGVSPAGPVVLFVHDMATPVKVLAASVRKRNVSIPNDYTGVRNGSTASLQPGFDQSMSIYIARGDATLGPYDPNEAARLIRFGLLFPDDFAARNGDPTWVPLVTLLPSEIVVPPMTVRPAQGETKIHKSGRPVALILLAVLILGGLLVATLRPFSVHPTHPPGKAKSATTAPIAAVEPPKKADAASPSPTLPARNPETIATPADKSCRLGGTVVLKNPDGTSDKFADIRVMAYLLSDLAPTLAEKKARVQTELDRLAPQIAAAEQERAARNAAERDALQAYLNAGPTDDLRSSLRFAHEEAKSELRTAEDDYRFFLGKRRDAMDGEFYFQDLPVPMAETRTNSEGEFALVLPSGGQFAVAASVRQTTVEGPRLHYWLVKISLEDGTSKTLVLGNNNVASAEAAESLIQTAE